MLKGRCTYEWMHITNKIVFLCPRCKPFSGISVFVFKLESKLQETLND
jgi:hypothetical protein